MNKIITITALIIAIFIISGCALLEEREEKWEPRYRLQAGLNHGGIVDNTEFDESVDGVVSGSKVDGLTGATKLGLNAGAHILLPIRSIDLELGCDYMYNGRVFEYEDVAGKYTGKRDIALNQLVFPITLNYSFFRDEYSGGLFEVKLGYVFQYNMCDITDSGLENLDHSTNNFSRGLTLGLAYIPFVFENNSRLGFYVDMYRGSKIYDDYYNSDKFEMPGSSYIKAGCIYEFGN